MLRENGLILEILKEPEVLKMGLFEQSEITPTLRHYSQCQVTFSEVNKLCREIVAVLNKTDKEGAVTPVEDDNLQKTGQLLWDQLLANAIKDKLKNNQGCNLILSIDEELISIPWELLHDGRDFLCLKFNLGRLIRTREQKSPVQYRSLGGKLKMMILANPTGDLKSSYLEGTYIKSQFDRKRKEIGIDFKSTCIDTLYVKKNLRDYDIVHFAGHCEYNQGNADKTGWVLNDGILNTQDIHAMSSSVSLPSLIFSNACYSAKTAGNLADRDCQEKTYSLAASFLFSGVRHYIGTIRRIEDPASSVFAREFYAQVINAKPLGECLRLARLRLIREYGIGSVSWASYLLYGDPGFVFFRPKTKPAAVKTKINIVSYKKTVAYSIAALSIVFICICLYILLPTVNPTTYFSFLRSRNLFYQGRNQEVIVSGSRIIKKDPLFLGVYPLLGDTYQRMGDKSNALKYYFEYALLSEKRRDKKSLAHAYIGLGWIYHLYGDYSSAADYYNKAIKLSTENKDKLNEARALRKLAVWHIDKEENEQALELLTKSSEINRERKHLYEYRYNLACDYFDIGLVFVNKHDYAAAKDFYIKSRDLFEKLKLKDEISDCYFNLGEICLFEKQFQKAKDFYMKGLELDLARDNKFKLVEDYNMIGELYVSMDNGAEAEKFFNQAISAAKQIEAPLELASVYYNLGLLYKHRKQKSKSREYLRQAQDIYRLIDSTQYQKIKQEFLDLANKDI